MPQLQYMFSGKGENYSFLFFIIYLKEMVYERFKVNMSDMKLFSYAFRQS